jgi:small-conductance mechanosensitive channel
MHSHLAQEWAVAWPLPAIAIALLVVLSFLRAVVDPAERGRVKAGIFFAGAYVVMVLAFGLLGRPMPTATQHDWLRVLAVLLFCFSAVIAASLVVFDIALRRRHIPRILQDLVQAVAYFITAAFVLTRSDVDVTRVFTASVLTTAVIGLALQETLGNIMAGLALQLERDFETGDWINLGDRASPIVGRIREVRWRATTIITKNGDLMLIPNSVITRAMITNYSRPTGAHRQWCATWSWTPSGPCRSSAPSRRRTVCSGSSGRTRPPTPVVTGSMTSSATTRSTATCAARSGTRCTGRGWRSRSRRAT